MVTHTERCIIS